MAIFSVTSTVSMRSLVRKSKHDLALKVLDLMDALDDAEERCAKVCDDSVKEALENLNAANARVERVRHQRYERIEDLARDIRHEMEAVRQTKTAIGFRVIAMSHIATLLRAAAAARREAWNKEHG